MLHTRLPCCLGLTLLAGDGNLKDITRLEDVPGEPPSFATTKDPWRTSALNLHNVSIERLFCSSPVQSAAAIRLNIIKLQLLLLVFLLPPQSHHLREQVMADATSAGVMRKRQASREPVWTLACAICGRWPALSTLRTSGSVLLTEGDSTQHPAHIGMA